MQPAIGSLIGGLGGALIGAFAGFWVHDSVAQDPKAGPLRKKESEGWISFLALAGAVVGGSVGAGVTTPSTATLPAGPGTTTPSGATPTTTTNPAATG